MEIDSDSGDLEYQNLEGFNLDTFEEYMPFEGEFSDRQNRSQLAAKHAETEYERQEKIQIIESLLECTNNVGWGEKSLHI